MKVSVSSYSFQQYINQGKMTQFDCIEKAKNMGFDAVEFTDIDGDTYDEQLLNAKKYKAKADEIGIPINAYTIGACLYNGDKAEDEKEVDRLKNQLEIAKILGAKVMRHDVCYSLSKEGSGRSFGLMLPTIAENARKVTDYAEKLGIRTCTENHGFIAQDSYRVEQLFNAVNHKNYGLLVDMGNFVCADEDPAKAVSRLAPYAVHIHIKDMMYREQPQGNCCNETRGCNYFCGTVVGEGDVPIKKCLQIVKKAGYDEYVSLEYEGSEDCINGISRGLKNIRKYLEEIE